MTSRGGRGAGVVLAAVAVAALGVGVVVLVPEAKKGDVDPVGMLVGGAGLVAGTVAAWLAWLTLRHGDTDPTATAVRLAGQVLAAETRARRRLLGGDAAAIDVRFAFRPAPVPAHDAAGARPEGTLRDVADYYRQLQPGRLVITGAPGSGKTVLAIELILALLDKRDLGDPVPVRLSLASWAELTTNTGEDPATPSAPDPDQVGAWLVRVLVETYRLRHTAARSLVDAGMVLPVLDGLDEMDAADTGTPLYRTRARHALDTLNAYQRGRDRAPLVLTSRSAAYLDLQALHVWARDGARVEITAVSLLQAREFVTRRASDPERWRTVLDHLSADPSSALARGLSTPWRLTVAVTAHEQRDPTTGAHLNTPRDLLNPALTSEDAVRDHLIRLLLTTTVRAHPPSGRPDPAQVRACLGTLAAYLNVNAATGRTIDGRTLSGTDLVPHELWPIAGPYRARATHTLLLIAAACLTGAVGVLAAVATGNRDSAVDVIRGATVATMGVAWSWRGWLEPARGDWSRLRTTSGRRRLAVGLAYGLAVALAVGLTVGLAVGLTYGLVVALAVGLVVGVTVGLNGGARATAGSGDVNREDFVYGLAVGLVGGLALGLAIALAAGLSYGLAVGLVGGLGGGLGLAGVAMRYVALVVCTRRGRVVLPWSLRRFLAWAEQAGLLRIAGNAYQFRHRELQDWLAAPANQV
ncbi:hypothetical protein OG216_44600 [Streptomycetaceae bacterium NBC_01309]